MTSLRRYGMSCPRESEDRSAGGVTGALVRSQGACKEWAMGTMMKACALGWHPLTCPHLSVGGSVLRHMPDCGELIEVFGCR